MQVNTLEHHKNQVFIDTDDDGPFAVTVNMMGTPYVVTLYREGMSFSVWSPEADCEDTFISRPWSVVADLLINQKEN